MQRNLRISVGLVVAFVAAAAIFTVFTAGNSRTSDESANAAPLASTTAQPETEPPAGDTTPHGDVRAVRTTDARQLGRKGSSGVTFTEFLDFECEACRAAYPLVEELRREYAGRVTFALRYFPIDSHQNARNAAIAVESAHKQGKLEAMYKRMYATQVEWGEQPQSQAPLFRSFAKDLGLDMKKYDASVKDPATEARVQDDSDAGTALGVQGTPSFFVNDTRIEPQSAEDLRRLLDEAIAKQ